jgi:hypothetical protein
MSILAVFDAVFGVDCTDGLCDLLPHQIPDTMNAIAVKAYIGSTSSFCRVEGGMHS